MPMVVKPTVHVSTREHLNPAGRVKRGYSTRERAERHMRALLRSGERNLNVYECADCRSWHVGHKRGTR